MIVYAISTHCRLLSLTCSEFLIDGSATLTIETSSTVMNIATQTRASASQRRGSGVWAAEGSIELLRDALAIERLGSPEYFVSARSAAQSWLAPELCQRPSISAGTSAAGR